jgi:hypothetical protein
MSPDSSSFAFVFLLSSIPIITANDTHMPLADVGSVVTPQLSLSNVYLILNPTLNLAFVDQLCDSGNYLVIFFSFFLLCIRSAVLETN